MSFVVGSVLARVIGEFGTLSGFDRDRAFYPSVVIVTASYYVLFAVMAGSASALVTELVIMAAFSAAAVAGFKKTQWFAVAALAAHALMDSVHGHLIENPGVPGFWPGFCLAFDVILAAFLARRLLRAA